ncbi:pyrimidine reductase family protein [Streptomyces sp. JJ38]|uniref:pyrimidine reductase family protein n=1 Tax=Streptomyces sp. JJ38 TaxID=2738128 RepID=UPI001C569AB8|nr:pyrimidine reductase family protein [Streptomyces sp. JJ38]MBW1598884.1 pyrimidine reductase family protein [Streptomyces sp. JJ38]
MRRLFPLSSEAGSDPDPTTDREWTLDELADAYGYPEPGDRPRHGPESAGTSWLRGNMVASLDGAAHHEGRSQPLSSDTDMRIFGVLRGLADAIVVGAETVRKEGYRPARARKAFAERRKAAGQTPAPAVVVLSAGLDLDFQAPLFSAPRTPTLIVTGAGAPVHRVEAAQHAGVRVLFAGEGVGADPARVPGVLAEEGHTRLLTEGGPWVLGEFAAAGVLDELCLTVAPRVTAGDAPRIMRGGVFPVPVDFGLESVLEEAGFLFTRYRRR